MSLISREELIEALLEARREETDTIPKLIRFIEKQPTVEPTTELSVANGDTLLVKTDWSIAGTPKCVVVTDGKHMWKYYYPEHRLVKEPKRGHWEIIDYEEPRRYGCSECKRMVWHTENYCPSCGSKMTSEYRNKVVEE